MPAQDYPLYPARKISQKAIQYMYIVYWPRLFGQDGWILASFFFCEFMSLYFVSIHKHAKKSCWQYPATSTKQAWSVTHIIIICIVYFYNTNRTQRTNHLMLKRCCRPCLNRTMKDCGLASVTWLTDCYWEIQWDLRKIWTVKIKRHW